MCASEEEAAKDVCPEAFQLIGEKGITAAGGDDVVKDGQLRLQCIVYHSCHSSLFFFSLCSAGFSCLSEGYFLLSQGRWRHQAKPGAENTLVKRKPKEEDFQTNEVSLMAGFADASRIRQLCKQYPKRQGREAETIEIGNSSCRTFGEWSLLTSLALVPWKSGETVDKQQVTLRERCGA